MIYLSLHCHHQNYFCIKVGSDESHFNVSVGSDGQSNRTVSTNHNLFEEKGEPKQLRTEVLPLTRRLTARPNRLTGDERGKEGTVFWAEGEWRGVGEGRGGRSRGGVVPAVGVVGVGGCVAWVDEGGSHKPCPQSVKSLHRYCTGWPKIILCLKHNASPPSLFVLPHRASAAV